MALIKTTYGVTPWIEYGNKKKEMAKNILNRLEECGGNLMALQGKYIEGGINLSRQYIIETIGEVEGLLLINQYDSIPKPSIETCIIKN